MISSAKDAGQALAKIGNDAALAALLNFARSGNKPSSKILQYIATFEMEPATDFLVEQGQWAYLWPKHKFLVLRSRDRCDRIAKLITKSISAERYSRVAAYDFLGAIIGEQGSAIVEQTLNAIVCLQPPKAGRADEGYEAEQNADDRARAEAYQRLIAAGNTELSRRGLRPAG